MRTNETINITMQLNQINSLALEITSHCNIRCPQCSRIDVDGNIAEFIELKHWDVSAILPNLQLEKMTNLKSVRIEGDNGDCIMHPDIVEIVSAVYNLPTQPRILILTNGSLRSTDWWFNFGKLFPGRLRVQFSIDGLEDTHALYRVGADYAKTVANARAFIAGGGEATQRCLIFDHNKHQLDGIRAASLDIGFVALQIRPGDLGRFQGEKTWKVFWKGKNTHDIAPISDFKFDFSPWEYNNTNVSQYFQFGSTSHHDDLNYLCPLLNNREISITYKGHLIPCCLYQADLYFMRDFNLDYQQLVGDLDQMDLNLRTLADIMSDSEYYVHRLEKMLSSKNRLPKCQSACGDRIDNRIIALEKLNATQ